LNCLRGFEAAARLGSFSRAAEALNMTQSAISHQVKTLENYLDQPLFIRVNRKVLLADAGKDLLATTDECMNLLDDGFRRLEQFKKPNQLIVHTSSAFASRWLLPRLGEYRRQNPGADVWLYTTDDKADLDLTEVHLAILYGSGHWPELSTTPILDDMLVPLCAPDHPIMQQQAVQAADLLNHGLLHGELRENWNDWFDALGADGIDLASGPNFSDSALLLQAAEQGQGIALGSLVLAAHSLAAGRLVSPLHRGIGTRSQYYLASRYEGLQSPLLLPFRSWLLEQLRDFNDNEYLPLKSRYQI
jgi:LysR family glycine cleavage system transcriptional activator